jgi:protein-S-isoprenylcysteine O-methyltransferase Ste14
MPVLITAVALAACWGTVIVVWVAGAAFNGIRAPRGGIRDRDGNAALIGATALCAAAALASQGYWSTLELDIPWVRVLGLVLLIVSTVFALWARIALGTSWSVAPEAGGDRRLHTSGPYGVTRHPIYTGLLGMILGSALLTGSGQVIVLVPVGLVLLSLKAHFEERLLSSTFPDEYAAYRRRVPRLVPGLSARRRRD